MPSFTRLARSISSATLTWTRSSLLRSHVSRSALASTYMRSSLRPVVITVSRSHSRPTGLKSGGG